MTQKYDKQLSLRQGTGFGAQTLREVLILMFYNAYHVALNS